MQVLATRIDTLVEMLASGELGMSYRHSIRPKLLVGLPQFRYGALIEDKNKPEEERYTYKGNLQTIPAKLINTTAGHSERLLRQDGGTSLAEIKKFHWRVISSHGGTREDFLKHCNNLDVSIDGVREAPKAKRTLLVVSVRLGGRIYALTIYNPLLGVPYAKPSLETVLRSVL